MRRLSLALAAGCLLAVAAAPTAGQPALTALPPSPAALPMRVSAAVAPSALKQFPVYDATGTLLRYETFRVTDAGGNCCEKYVAATAGGRLLELGGSYPYFSDDGGVTWSSASPPVPLLNGEGAISTTPTGDVVGTSWDAYSGDRLVAFRYSPASGTWLYHEMPLHGPFFDRPWLTVVEGPFTAPDGTTVPWISVVRGGTGGTREVELVSDDGLVYASFSPTDQTAALLGSVAGPLPVVADPHTDLLQPHPRAKIAPLAGTGAIRTQEAGVLCRSGLQVLRADRTWACLDLGTVQVAGDVRADGRGWLHEVRYAGATVTYRVSTDGGTTWQATTHTFPGTIADAEADVKVDSPRLRTYVALRVTGPGGQQDTVLRFGTTGGVPALAEVFHIGLGDFVSGSSVAATGARMDFASLALLPDGRFAVAFEDSTKLGSVRPRLAIQQ